MSHSYDLYWGIESGGEGEEERGQGESILVYNHVIVTCRYYSSLYSDGCVRGNSLSPVCPW